MYNARQKEILAAIAQGLNLPQHSSPSVHVDQTPGYVNSPIEVHDFAVALMGAIGATIASIGESRGLGAQRVTVDRRHAGLLFNEIALFLSKRLAIRHQRRPYGGE